MHRCQIYALLSSEGLVDYVGRTNRPIAKRMQEHKADLGFLPIYKIVDRCSTNCAAVERRWIQYYRVSGCALRNVDYGQGPHRHSDEAKRKLSAAFKGRPVTWGDKISATQKGVQKRVSPEGIEKQKATRFKSGECTWDKKAPLQRKEHIEKVRGAWADPDKRARMSSGLIRDGWSRMSLEQQAEHVKKCRERFQANPDIARQGAAALLAKDPDNMKRRITKFWEEIRKDPQRYREYIDRRTQAIVEAKAKKNFANL